MGARTFQSVFQFGRTSPISGPRSLRKTGRLRTDRSRQKIKHDFWLTRLLAVWRNSKPT